MNESMQMSDNELEQLVCSISKNVFGKPFRHTARFNPRLRTTGGRYMLADHSIEMNPLVLQLYDLDELKGIIQHESCHYHLHLEGKGYQHRDQDFKVLLKQTGSPRYCKPLTVRKTCEKIHYYQCTACFWEYCRKKRMDPSKYRCGKCAGKIQYVKSCERK